VPRYPTTGVGILLTVGVVLVALAALATTGLGPILLATVLVGIVLYVVYVLAVNVHRWATTRYDRGGS